MFSDPQTPRTIFEDSPETKFPGSSNLRLSETSIIQTKLNRRLGPEYVSQRPAPGGGPKLTYVEGWKIIGLANEVFGYNGWNSTITSLETDFADMDLESKRWSVGVTAVVKITLKDGTHHEDIGYGTGDNLRNKGAALDKAKKEAVTDGVKRALRNFGNLLGLCLYEKSFTQEVLKIKPQPPKFDESDLHRRESSVCPPTSSSSGIQDDSSTRLGYPAEDRTRNGSPSPQIRSTHSKPSPLREAISAYGNGQPRRGLSDGILPRKVPSPQQGPSSERNGTVLSLPKQLDTKPVTPKAEDSDPDAYFKEDNDLFLAVEDPNCGTGTTRKTDLDAIKNDSSPSGTRPQPAVASVTTSNNRTSAPPQDQPVPPLRQAIRASIASLAAAGVKRPVEAMQSSNPQPGRTGMARQQQRSAADGGGYEGLFEEGADVKRIRR